MALALRLLIGGAIIVFAIYGPRILDAFKKWKENRRTVIGQGGQVGDEHRTISLALDTAVQAALSSLEEEDFSVTLVVGPRKVSFQSVYEYETGTK